MLIIFECKFGSHLYGTQTSLSDLDYKVIYLPDISTLIMGETPPIFKERDTPDQERVKPQEVERDFIPIHRFFKDFFAGQSWAIEVACGVLCGYAKVNPIFSEKYIFEMIEELMPFLTNDVNKMLGFVQKQASVYGNKGRRLGQLSKIVSDLSGKEFVQLSEVSEYFGTLNDDEVFLTGTRPLGLIPAVQIFGKQYLLSARKKDFLASLTGIIKRYGERSKLAVTGDDFKALSHAVRVFQQVIEVLQTGKIQFPISNAELCLDIKCGKLTGLEISEILDELSIKVQNVRRTSLVQNKTDEIEEKFRAFMLKTLSSFYGV